MPPASPKARPTYGSLLSPRRRTPARHTLAMGTLLPAAVHLDMHARRTGGSVALDVADRAEVAHPRTPKRVSRSRRPRWRRQALLPGLPIAFGRVDLDAGTGVFSRWTSVREPSRVGLGGDEKHGFRLPSPGRAAPRFVGPRLRAGAIPAPLPGWSVRRQRLHPGCSMRLRCHRGRVRLLPRLRGRARCRSVIRQLG